MTNERDQGPRETTARPVAGLALGVVRLLLVPAALIWILTHFAGVSWSTATFQDPESLVGGLIVNQIALLVFAARMNLILRLFEVRISFYDAFRIHLQSMFYFFALPMTVGLELARYFKIRQIKPSTSLAQLSSALLLDRLVGAGSALAVGVVCFPLVSGRLAVELPPLAVFAVLGAAGLLAGGALLWPGVRRILVKGLQLTKGRWLRLAGIFALSMIMHVLFAAGVQLAAVGVGLSITLVDAVFAVALGMLLVAIPVSVGGIGPAEAGAAGLFLALGYPPTVALTAGALPYLARLVAALEGAAWELVESSSATLAATRRLISRRESA